jgi:hypothetical protein
MFLSFEEFQIDGMGRDKRHRIFFEFSLAAGLWNTKFMKPAGSVRQFDRAFTAKESLRRDEFLCAHVC